MAELAAIAGDQNRITTAAPTADGDTAEEEPDCFRRTKRQKKFPKALEKIEEFVPSRQACSSFTFDTKSITCGQEITPKFGSFNSAKEKDQGREILADKKEGQQQQQQKQQEELDLVVDL